ncbi:MAG: alpha/beta hydrolase [Alphaproteobacteria bacterium]|nr:alpha/beta hydrolase [Alphaproteobacteria bacterium]
MRQNFKFFILIFTLLFSLPAQAGNKEELVVLLHGIARTSSSMNSIESMLQKDGYTTLNITYPSKKKDLNGLAEYLKKEHLIDSLWKDYSHIHVITHSMGGLVARRYFDRYKNDIPKDKLGKIIMLAPPNKGSKIADIMQTLLPYKWYYGPSGSELTTEVQRDIKSDIYYDLGVIAGTKEWPYFVAAFVIPGKSDGRVSVNNTKIKGMTDFLTVNGTHTFIMNKPEVHSQILYFLRHSKFKHNN